MTVSFLCRGGGRSLALEAKKVGEQGLMDLYEAHHPGTREKLYYFVYFRTHEDRQLYGRNGLREASECIPFSVNPSFHVPDWARGAVWYQIFPDRFYNGNTDNDVKTGEIRDDVDLISRQMRWDDPVAPLDVHHYYGGDLEGVIEKLDYLKHLGIQVIYLNPIFTAPSSHHYNTQDYLHVDPHLAASDDVLAELISEAHRRGMRVVLDGVFNHCSIFHSWNVEQKDGYFGTDESGCPEVWWGNKNLLKLNVDGSPELREEIMKIAEKWLLPPYGADGWRLDVAADVGHSSQANHAFWEEFRKRVHAANPDALILAEHYGDPSDWLGGDEWDSVMNYDAFMDPVSWLLTAMEKHSDRYVPWMLGDAAVFRRDMENAMARFPRPSLECALNQLDNHDHSRFLTRTNHTVGRLGALGWLLAEKGTDQSVLRAAVLLQMTWPGAPGIYYGDEAGLCGFTDPDNRRPFPWGREDAGLIDFYENMIRLRRHYPVLRSGSLRFLEAEEGLLIYLRFDQKDRILSVINAVDKQIEEEIDLAETDGVGTDCVRRLALTSGDGCNMGSPLVAAKGGILKLSVKAHEAALYYWKVLEQGRNSEEKNESDR